MKKALLLIAVMTGCLTLSAQKLDKNEMRQMQQFLSQPAEKDATNAQALKISDLKNASTWEGVTVENGHITAIDWADKHLAGSLDLSGFTALTKVNVSRNALTALNVKGASAVVRIDAQRNKISNFAFDGCKALNTLNIYKNRITDLTISNAPFLQTSISPTTSSWSSTWLTPLR